MVFASLTCVATLYITVNQRKLAKKYYLSSRLK